MKKEKSKITYLVVGIVLIIAFGYLHKYVGMSSDNTTTLPMSIDILNGNIWLKEWILGTNNFYFTEIIVYAIGKIIGFSNITLLSYIPAIAWVILYLLLFYFILFYFMQDAKSLSKKELSFYIIVTGCLLLIPGKIVSYVLLNANSHMNLYAFLVIYMILVSKYIDSDKKIFLIPITLLGGLLEFSEGVTTMVLIAPVLCVCILAFIKKEKKFIFLFVSVIFSYLGGKLLFKIFAIFGGMKTVGLPVGIVSIKELPERFLLWINEFMGLLGGNVYSPEPLGFKKIVIILWIIILVISLLYYTINIFKIDWKYQLVYFIVVINFAACIFTDVAVTYRYVVVGFYFGYFLTICFLIDVLKKINKSKIFYCVIILIAICLAGNKVRDWIPFIEANTSEMEMAKIIQDNNLGNGYAGFWNASIVSAYTDYQSQILPAYIQPDSGIKEYSELIKTSWYEDDDFHYVIMNKLVEDDGFINFDSLINLCGNPDRQYECGTYILYYWEKDISYYLNNGLSDMCLTPYELSHNESVEMNDDSCVVHPNGVVFGPYEYIEKGTYLVTYVGENMDILSFDVYSREIDKIFDLKIESQDDKEITYSVNISEDVNDVEFRVINMSNEDAIYYKTNIVKQKLE